MFDGPSGPPGISASDVALHDGAGGLWDSRFTGQGKTIAIIDTGINPDVLGKSMVWEVDLANHSNPRDVVGHGTMMAYCAQALAPDCMFANVKVVNDYGYVTRESVIAGLEECLQRKNSLDIINISISIPNKRFGRSLCTTARQCDLCEKVNEIVEQGICVVAAAGNTGKWGYTCPGNARRCLTVLASDNPFGQTTGSTSTHAKWYRRWLKLARKQGQLPTGRKLHSGTSVSAATASGGCALIMSALDVSQEDIERARIISAALLIPNLEQRVLRSYYQEREATSSEELMRLASEDSQEFGYGIGLYRTNLYRMYVFLQIDKGGGKVLLEEAAADYEQGTEFAEAGRLEEAEESFRRMTFELPFSPLPWLELGRIYLKRNQDKEAVKSLAEAVRFAWHWPTAHYEFATALRRIGMSYEAESHDAYGRVYEAATWS